MTSWSVVQKHFHWSYKHVFAKTLQFSGYAILKSWSKRLVLRLSFLEVKITKNVIKTMLIFCFWNSYVWYQSMFYLWISQYFGGVFCRCSMLLDICTWNAYNEPYWEFEIKYQNYLSETSLIQLRWFHFYLLFIFLPSISQNNNIWYNKKSLPFAI